MFRFDRDMRVEKRSYKISSTVMQPLLSFDLDPRVSCSENFHANNSRLSTLMNFAYPGLIRSPYSPQVTHGFERKSSRHLTPRLRFRHVHPWIWVIADIQSRGIQGPPGLEFVQCVTLLDTLGSYHFLCFFCYFTGGAY